jgi:hypothetical protein
MAGAAPTAPTMTATPPRGQFLTDHIMIAGLDGRASVNKYWPDRLPRFTVALHSDKLMPAEPATPATVPTDGWKKRVPGAPVPNVPAVWRALDRVLSTGAPMSTEKLSGLWKAAALNGLSKKFLLEFLLSEPLPGVLSRKYDLAAEVTEVVLFIACVASRGPIEADQKKKQFSMLTVQLAARLVLLACDNTASWVAYLVRTMSDQPPDGWTDNLPGLLRLCAEQDACCTAYQLLLLRSPLRPPDTFEIIRAARPTFFTLFCALGAVKDKSGNIVPVTDALYEVRHGRHEVQCTAADLLYTDLYITGPLAEFGKLWIKTEKLQIATVLACQTLSVAEAQSAYNRTWRSSQANAVRVDLTRSGEEQLRTPSPTMAWLWFLFHNPGAVAPKEYRISTVLSGLWATVAAGDVPMAPGRACLADALCCLVWATALTDKYRADDLRRAAKRGRVWISDQPPRAPGISAPLSSGVMPCTVMAMAKDVSGDPTGTVALIDLIKETFPVVGEGFVGHPWVDGPLHAAVSVLGAPWREPLADAWTLGQVPMLAHGPYIVENTFNDAATREERIKAKEIANEPVSVDEAERAEGFQEMLLAEAFVRTGARCIAASNVCLEAPSWLSPIIYKRVSDPVVHISRLMALCHDEVAFGQTIRVLLDRWPAPAATPAAVLQQHSTEANAYKAYLEVEQDDGTFYLQTDSNVDACIRPVLDAWAQLAAVATDAPPDAKKTRAALG